MASSSKHVLDQLLENDEQLCEYKKEIKKLSDVQVLAPITCEKFFHRKEKEEMCVYVERFVASWNRNNDSERVMVTLENFTQRIVLCVNRGLFQPKTPLTLPQPPTFVHRGSTESECNIVAIILCSNCGDLVKFK